MSDAASSLQNLMRLSTNTVKVPSSIQGERLNKGAQEEWNIMYQHMVALNHDQDTARLSANYIAVEFKRSCDARFLEDKSASREDAVLYAKDQIEKMKVVLKNAMKEDPNFLETLFEKGGSRTRRQKK
eukprot:754121-Hanusia_phi.AAC.2